MRKRRSATLCIRH